MRDFKELRNSIIKSGKEMRAENLLHSRTTSRSIDDLGDTLSYTIRMEDLEDSINPSDLN